MKEKNKKNNDELTSKVRLLGYDFSVAIHNGNKDVGIEIIGKLSTIWRN